MEYLIGVLLAIVVVVASALIGLDRELSFYATVLIVVASYYALFAVMAGSGHTRSLSKSWPRASSVSSPYLVSKEIFG